MYVSCFSSSHEWWRLRMLLPGQLDAPVTGTPRERRIGVTWDGSSEGRAHQMLVRDIELDQCGANGGRAPGRQILICCIAADVVSVALDREHPLRVLLHD